MLKGDRQVTRLITKPLSSAEDSAISEDIKSLFESSNITQPKKVYLNIPRHLATIRFLRIPSTDEVEIKKILKIESVKYLPYQEEGIIYGYRVIARSEDGYSNILLAIVQAATIKRFITIFKMAQLDIEHISIGSEALYLWYTLVRGARSREDAMLVNIDREHIDIDILKDGGLAFTRGALYDRHSPSAAEGIIEQIRLSITAYQKGSAQGVNKIILSGIRDRLNECEGLLKEAMNVPVEIQGQMENIKAGKEAEIDLDDASFVELLGVSLKPKDIKVNLMPEDIIEESRIIQSRSNLIVTLTLIALMSAVVFGLVSNKLHDKKMRLLNINSELNRMEPRVAIAKNMVKDINIISEVMAKKPLAIDILSEVCRLTPEEITFNLLDFESNNHLTIRGSTPALSDIFKYVNVLEASPYLENVRVKYATKRVAGNIEMADFEINCDLTSIK